MSDTLSGSAMNRRENAMRQQSTTTQTYKSKRIPPKPKRVPEILKNTVPKKKKKPSYLTPSKKSADYQWGNPNGVQKTF